MPERVCSECFGLPLAGVTPIEPPEFCPRHPDAPIIEVATDKELRSEIERLREALRELLDVTEAQDAEWDDEQFARRRNEAHDRARAALTPRDEGAAVSLHAKIRALTAEVERLRKTARARLDLLQVDAADRQDERLLEVIAAWRDADVSDEKGARP